jgi:Family of unknown function (DUF5677)
MPDSSEEQLREAEAAVQELIQASTTAYETVRGTLKQMDMAGWAKHHRGLVGLIEHAERTSRSIEMLRAAGLVLQALALLRVRLEEAIVCSYLIHESSDTLYRRYFSFGPIAEFRTAVEVLRDPQLSEYVARGIDIDDLRKEALEIEKSFDPGFDLDNGKFTPKWTTLDLYSMAQRRDKLCAVGCRARDLSQELGIVFPVLPLSSLYTSVYRTASAVVHADASLLSTPFSGQIKGSDGRLLDARRFWMLAIPAYMVTLDQLQSMEVLSALERYG